MEKMRYFIDTHDKVNGTFPEGINKEQLAEFYKSYEQACKEEGVISVRIDVGLEQGRAFCMNIAPNEEAVFNVHKKAGLPYDNITEIESISQFDLFFKQ